jgi:3',5'-cyclic AMP phosphodiesterase CpdA
MIVVAHVSDLHIDDGERSRERAAAVMAYLDRLAGPIDAVLVTGDIADHGLPGEYEHVRKILPTRYPVLTVPGNHDVRAAYREVLLGEEPADGPVNRVGYAGGAAFLLCDSTVPGEARGELAGETVAWLEEALAGTSGRPVFVCFHHPPVMLYAPYIDRIRQFGVDRLAAAIERNPEVVAVLCGHAHTGAASTFAGRPVLVAPGVVSTVQLPWVSPDLIDLDHPPAVAFHVLDAGRRLTTHFRAVRL